MDSQTYGGFLNLDFKFINNIESDYYCFNSGRSALNMLLKKTSPSLIKIPAYTCNAVIDCIKKLKIPFEIYFLDENLLPKDILLGNNEWIIVNNYFGIIQNLISQLDIDTSKIIVDNSQLNFFTDIKDSTYLSFYSPRKFFGLPDGGLINRKLINLDEYRDLPHSFSYSRIRHLLESIEKGKEFSYSKYLESEMSINKDTVAKMSKLTQVIIESYDLDFISTKRNFNFNFLHENLKDYNQLSYIINLTSPKGALCYPFLFREIRNIKKIKAEFIKNKIFIPTYWPGVENRILSKHIIEFNLLNNLLCIPIDQNISKTDISKMLKIMFKILNLK